MRVGANVAVPRLEVAAVTRVLNVVIVVSIALKDPRLTGSLDVICSMCFSNAMLQSVPSHVPGSLMSMLLDECRRRHRTSGYAVHTLV